MSQDPKIETPAPAVASDADLMRKIEMLEAQIDVKNKQLRQAIDIAQRANDQQKARDEAEKAKLIDSIIVDSKMSKDDLQGKPLSELQTIRFTLDKALEKTFASVAAELDEAKHRRAPLLTAGKWNGKEWIGGL